MKKKCPKCGSKKIKGQKVCPDCGFSLEENDQHIQNKRDVVESKDQSLEQLPEENNQPDFPDTELNDPIEWAELKDLPLESVMELFDASEKPEAATEKETADERMEEKKEKAVKPMKKNRDKQPKDQNEINTEKGLSVDEVVEKEKQERITQLKENVKKEDDQSILAAYIQAHREDVDEEQSKELMQMIHEKIAADQTPEIAEGATNIKEEKSTDTEAVVSDSVKSDDEKEKKIERPEDLATKEKTVESVVEEQESKVDEAEKTVEEPVTVSQKQSAKDESLKIAKEGSNENLKKASKKEKVNSPKRDAIVNQPAEAEEPAEQMTKKPAVTSVKADQKTRKEPATITPNPEQPTEKSKRVKKGPYLLLAAVILLGVGGWAYYDNQQKVEAERIAEVARQEKQVSEIKKELASFYVGDTNEFIRTDHLNQDLSKIKQELNEVDSTKDYQELNETYNDIQAKIINIKKINDLFIDPVIEEDHLAEKPVLRSTDKIEAIETDDSDFGKLIQKAQQEAQKQLEQIETAKEKTKVVFQDEKVVDSATRDQYKVAKEAVDKIANKELADPFKQQLTKVDHQLAEKEKEAAEKKAAEEKAKQEAEQKAKAEQVAAAQAAQAEKAAQEAAKANAASSTTTVGSGSTANQPIMGTNASDVADSSNAAWNWASGVRESVIATCIQRGYIVEGGYKLEKAQIRNGEGYYNLYATSTKSSLMNGIGESALPFYIVTINCKTGWFGGNGSN
ncbi:cell division site-positioning protein MapZ family protein [Candidatus Enterococcus courvalinii]|uniref:TFIIB-type zinc ribbon-containing protein n=1 Tax=Candidatus Enterococcus courvalinii TaxID=2815329 RepID=A0ABS3HZU1_9ENTE|nr:TFIIB-type zinc ribbon-containing protein [Enterococcus sp. MSG2901]